MARTNTHNTHFKGVSVLFLTFLFLLGTIPPGLWLGYMKWLFQMYLILVSSKRKPYWASWCLYAMNRSAVSRDNLEICFKSTLLMKTKSSCRLIQCFLKGILNLSSAICKVILGNTAELKWVMYLKCLPLYIYSLLRNYVCLLGAYTWYEICRGFFLLWNTTPVSYNVTKFLLIMDLFSYFWSFCLRAKSSYYVESCLEMIWLLQFFSRLYWNFLGTQHTYWNLSKSNIWSLYLRIVL